MVQTVTRSATASRAVMMTTGTRFRAPQPLQDVDAVAPRQREIEQRKVVEPMAECELGFGAVAHPVDRVARVLKARDHGTPDHRVVFDYQYSHCLPPLPVSLCSDGH